MFLVLTRRASHPNSVDKDKHGDYLLSSRFTSTIYKISGIDGSIIWRLGGLNSSFILGDFNFSKQHDAEFRPCTQGKECISFFNNAVSDDDGSSTSAWSSAMVVALDSDTMTATLAMEIPRPDHKLSSLRGNVQMLPNSNVLVHWSDNAYLSEFTTDNRHILDARFASERFVSYRGYKFNMTLIPQDDPIMKAFIYGPTPNESMTVFYVSWNGATEVATWEFFATANVSGECYSVGAIAKTGFETQFAVPGLLRRGFARAVASDGTVLGQSLTSDLSLPLAWDEELKPFEQVSQPIRQTWLQRIRPSSRPSGNYTYVTVCCICSLALIILWNRSRCKSVRKGKRYF